MLKARVAIFSMLSIISIATFANQSDCNNSEFLHCSYFSGLPSDVNDGRFVKETYLGSSNVSCSDNTVFQYMTAEDAVSQGSGAITVQYSICQDATGTDCEKVGEDAFTIIKNGNTYSAEPKVYNIDFSHVDVNKFKSCKPYFGKTE
jgi:hypothetical protein